MDKKKEKQSVLQLLFGFMDRANGDHVGAYAAQAAYFLIMSFIPFILFLTTIIRYTPLTYNMVSETIRAFVPHNIQNFVLTIVSEVYGRSTAVVPISDIMALWSAGKAMQSLTNGLNSIYHVHETRNWLITRMYAVVYTFLFSIAIIASLLLLVLGNQIQIMAGKYVPFLGRIIGKIIGARTALVFAGLFLIFLILSGLSTGISWLCYFKALQIGDINKVTPIDKSSTVITMLLAFIFLREEITWLKFVSMILIGIGTYLMIQKKETKEKAEDKKWLLYAVGSAVFASLTSILGKIGIQDVNSNLGTAIRTAVVLVMAWIVVFVTGKQNTVNNIDRKSWLFLILSGFATGGSWLCYYRALQTGPASVIVPIDKLSILVTVAFSYIVFHEKLSLKSGTGLLLIVVGTLALLI